MFTIGKNLQKWKTEEPTPEPPIEFSDIEHEDFFFLYRTK
jgi:hypothetical protein